MVYSVHISLQKVNIIVMAYQVHFFSVIVEVVEYAINGIGTDPRFVVVIQAVEMSKVKMVGYDIFIVGRQADFLKWCIRKK